ncbi:NADH:flavin oxidoreductase [uncultured Desulfobacterium sp.]|uniref:NADH:flavin oxidoreductase n=1 Tax=uncultured Desulfobacterium sp. TaxID=201089 RepID=A0A445N0A0_9BACT|nr:NADH:flavin oxidoreductase [uncultured Desulfobacterium sp.]
MTSNFPNLMSVCYIGNVELKNRIITAPLWTGFADRDGSVTPRTIAFYTEKARGGSGLITIEYSYVDQVGSKSAHGQLGIYDDECVPGFAILAQTIHDQGVKCAVQIAHAGAMKFLPIAPWLGPSDGFHDLSLMGPLPPLPITGMTREQIFEQINAFASAAERVKKAGFDMVDIHVAHGYLLTEFLSTHANKRDDEYGGSLENRMRFPIEVVSAVRQRVGADFPVTVRINGTDYAPDSPITIDEAIIFAKKLEEAGVDAIHVSGGTDIYLDKLATPTYLKHGFNVYLAETVKKKAGVKVPIIATGGITTPAFAEEILRDGRADFIALGRPALADPSWARKIEEGRPEDIIPCIRCNDGCLRRTIGFSRATSCAVNPRMGFETIRVIAPLKEKKRVAIIGGGPGGMEAARLAAIRGHDVTLYEKRRLGGALIEASWDTDLKRDIPNLIEYYQTQMKKLDVKIVRKEATVNSIAAGGFDAVIVANGAISIKLDIPGIDKLHVYEALDVTGGKDKDLGNTIVVVGGGVLACEIALSQAKKGKKVTITAPEGCYAGEYEIGGDNYPNRLALMEQLKENKVGINLCLLPKEITDHGIISTDKEGKEREFKADSIVVCRGFEPDKRLSNALKGKVKQVRPIGDCVQARFIYEAIHEGWVAANEI